VWEEYTSGCRSTKGVADLEIFVQDNVCTDFYAVVGELVYRGKIHVKTSTMQLERDYCVQKNCSIYSLYCKFVFMFPLPFLYSDHEF
jgi:hypothetical protein